MGGKVPMVVVDGIRYRPEHAPKHKAILAPQPSHPAPPAEPSPDPTGDTAGIGAAPGELDDKAALLEALRAAGATNMATLERYGVARLQAELDKLTGED